MKCDKRYIVILMGMIMFCFSNLNAQDVNNYSISGSLGTLGSGVEGSISITPYLKTRIGVNYLSFEDVEMDKGSIGNLDYELDTNTFTTGIMLDYYPWKNGFYTSFGVYYFNQKTDFESDPSYSRKNRVGDGIYSYDEIGVIKGDIKRDEFCPYLGIGWDFKLTRSWNLLLDAGVIYVNDYDLKIEAIGGSLVNDEEFQRNLKVEENDIKDDSDLKYYPVITVKALYNF